MERGVETVTRVRSVIRTTRKRGALPTALPPLPAVGDGACGAVGGLVRTTSTRAITAHAAAGWPARPARPLAAKRWGATRGDAPRQTWRWRRLRFRSRTAALEVLACVEAPAVAGRRAASTLVASPRSTTGSTDTDSRLNLLLLLLLQHGTASASEALWSGYAASRTREYGEQVTVEAVH